MNTDVLIIGGGPAGLSAAIWCKRLNIPHILLERKPRLGGQLHAIHNPIVDYPGLEAANGAELAERFVAHLRDIRAVVRLNAEVEKLDPDSRTAWVRETGEGRDGPVSPIGFRAVILATGARDRRLNVPGEAEMRSRGEIYSATRDAGRLSGKRVAVVGGGDRAFEGAWLLAEAGAQVLLLHRSERFRARAELIEIVTAHPRIEIRTNAVVTRIEGERKTETIVIRDQNGQDVREPVEAVLVRIGVEADSDLLRPYVRTGADGRIVTDATGLTSRSGCYAIGDVSTEPVYSSIVSSAGQGMAAVKHILYHSGLYRPPGP